MEPKTSNEGSSSRHTGKEKAMDVEPIARAGGGVGSGSGGDGNGYGLFQRSPPPFLRKTFEMVEDPETNDLISWSATGKSFVIWEHNQFANDLLPIQFRHRNLSSFIYQLNSYGFKKISPSHYEYANPYFQADKKHLLYNIKKRTPQPNYNNINALRKRARESSSWQDVGADGSDEADIEKLKNNLNTMEKVLGELKQQQDATEKRLAAIEKRIEGADVGIKQEVFTFMTNAIANPLFVKNFFKNVAKKQRLVVHQSAGGSVKLGDLNKKSGEDFTTNNLEVTTDPNLKCDDKSISIAKKLLDEEDLVCVSRAEDQQHQSRIVMELEDLIAKPSGGVDFDWAEYVKELMHQSGLP
ncbi:hypothetical protein RHSIM_Rhsim02G0071200 [Rhododendron simsii]|uniref:HSF-type DNA-binding domain-containing protein n=1 Tax=Rhododendron simsii TaxID=118357 RepID=A0A834LYN6_RHOSS|nr:hypothetical protein RHSIM_Rhsim02G0071200 [Rhododendron simsii]